MSFVYSNAKNFYEQGSKDAVVDSIVSDTIASATTNTDLSLSGAGSGNVRVTDGLEVASINGLATDGHITIAANGTGQFYVNRTITNTSGDLTISPFGNIMLSADSYVETSADLIVQSNGVGKVWCQLIDARSFDGNDSGNLGLYTEPEVGSILLWTDVLQTCDHTNVTGNGVDYAVTGGTGSLTVRDAGGAADVTLLFVNGLYVGIS